MGFLRCDAFEAVVREQVLVLGMLLPPHPLSVGHAAGLLGEVTIAKHSPELKGGEGAHNLTVWADHACLLRRSIV